MKKNAFAALIILILTIAFLFVVNDLSHSTHAAHGNSYKASLSID